MSEITGAACPSLTFSYRPLHQSDTEFWDKMQAEWEELARRNWLTENEQAQIPTTVSPHEKVTIIRDDTAETGSLWRVNNVGYGSNYTVK